MRSGQRLQLREAIGVVFRQQFDTAPHRGQQLTQLLVFDSGLITHLGRRRISGAHAGQRALVVLVIAVLLLQQLDAHWIGEGAEQFFLLLQIDVEVGQQTLGAGGIALGQHELQTGDPQIGQRGVQLRDFAHPATALDNATQAAPGSPGQRQGQRQHQAEAESKLAGHAEISEPGVHKNSPTADVSGLAGELFLLTPAQ